MIKYGIGHDLLLISRFIDWFSFEIEAHLKEQKNDIVNNFSYM